MLKEMLYLVDKKDGELAQDIFTTLVPLHAEGG